MTELQKKQLLEYMLRQAHHRYSHGNADQSIRALQEFELLNGYYRNMTGFNFNMASDMGTIYLNSNNVEGGK